MSHLEPENFDPRRRRLCPDGSCVGVIGADGRCRMCGAADSDGPGLTATDFQGGCASEPEDDQPAAGGEVAEAALSDQALLGDETGAAEGRSGFDPRRALCPDGACVGVLGEDRRCKFCGQLAER